MSFLECEFFRFLELNIILKLVEKLKNNLQRVIQKVYILVPHCLKCLIDLKLALRLLSYSIAFAIVLLFRGILLWIFAPMYWSRTYIPLKYIVKTLYKRHCLFKKF